MSSTNFVRVSAARVHRIALRQQASALTSHCVRSGAVAEQWTVTPGPIHARYMSQNSKNVQNQFEDVQETVKSAYDSTAQAIKTGLGFATSKDAQDASRNAVRDAAAQMKDGLTGEKAMKAAYADAKSALSEGRADAMQAADRPTEDIAADLKAAGKSAADAAMAAGSRAADAAKSGLGMVTSQDSREAEQAAVRGAAKELKAGLSGDKAFKSAAADASAKLKSGHQEAKATANADPLHDLKEDVKAAAEEMAGKSTAELKGDAKHAAEEAKATAKKTAETAKDDVQYAKDVAGQMASSAKAAAADAKDTIKDSTRNAQQTARDKAHVAKETAEKEMHKAGVKAEQIKEDAKKSL